MSSGSSIRGVLFDSGGVLIRPIGGRWNPRCDFEAVLHRHHPEIRAEWFPAAFAAGQRLLDAGDTTANRTDYHRTMLRVLGVEQPSAGLLSELEGPAAGPVVELFPDVRRVLERLQAAGVRMSVVSDGWAGLEELHRQLDIERYFEAFVVSEVLGCCKPDPRMYRAGSDALGLEPHECIFIDDVPELVAAAIDLGYQGVALQRERPSSTDVPTISSLDGLLEIVARSSSSP